MFYNNIVRELRHSLLGPGCGGEFLERNGYVTLEGLLFTTLDIKKINLIQEIPIFDQTFLAQQGHSKKDELDLFS